MVDCCVSSRRGRPSASKELAPRSASSINLASTPSSDIPVTTSTCQSETNPLPTSKPNSSTQSLDFSCSSEELTSITLNKSYTDIHSRDRSTPICVSELKLMPNIRPKCLTFGSYLMPPQNPNHQASHNNAQDTQATSSSTDILSETTTSSLCPQAESSSSSSTSAALGYQNKPPSSSIPMYPHTVLSEEQNHCYPPVKVKALSLR